MVAINYWAVLLGGVSSMVVGMLYYSDGAYGKLWKKLAKVDQKRFEKEMKKVMPFVFLCALVLAWTVAYMTSIFHGSRDVSWMTAALTVTTLLWAGVTATTLIVHDSLDQRPMKLTALSLGNRLLSLLAMGLLIGWLHP